MVRESSATLMSAAAGSMGPKVEAASKFVLANGNKTPIGSLDQIEEMVAGNAGTEVSAHAAVL